MPAGNFLTERKLGAEGTIRGVNARLRCRANTQGVFTTMSPSHSLYLSSIALLLASCHQGAEPASPSAAAATAAAAPEASTASGYPMCAGQHLAQPSQAPHTGAVDAQLAPAFLD